MAVILFAEMGGIDLTCDLIYKRENLYKCKWPRSSMDRIVVS